jgi:ribosome-interacting GTPase 1
MAKTQKNKATSFHLGQLKAKLAKLKRDLLTPTSGGGGGPGGKLKAVIRVPAVKG